MQSVSIGQKFKYKGKEFKIITIDNGLIVAKCLELGVVPAYQPFRVTEDGDFVRR